MALIYCTGFEARDSLIELGALSMPSGVSFETTIVRSGTTSLKILPASGSSVSNVAVGPSTSSKYTRFYLRVTVLPTVTARHIYGSGLPGNVGLFLGTDGSLQLITSDSAVVAVSSTLLTNSSTWYRVEFLSDYSVSVTGSDTVLKVDGVSSLALSTVTGGAYSMGTIIGCLDSLSGTYTAYVDDFAQDNANFPGPGAGLLSLPVSDNARGGWTAGAGGTTNLFDAVNNKPPVGVAAASATNTSQIKSATNSATDNCDLNMQSYTTIGIPAGSTINGVVLVVATGEEIATGLKNGAIKIVSNPAQSVEDSTLVFGGDAGAQGTYPTLWNVYTGSAQSGAGVTLGTSPVARIGKRTATTRIVSCCYIGMNVDYTPPSGAISFIAGTVVSRPIFVTRKRRIIFT